MVTGYLLDNDKGRHPLITLESITTGDSTGFSMSVSDAEFYGPNASMVFLKCIPPELAPFNHIDPVDYAEAQLFEKVSQDLHLRV
jgi:hypothetical protein